MLYLDLNKVEVPMKRVYLLSEELKNDPVRVANAQAMTLNDEKLLLGLKGTYGLFGSAEWWGNIEQRKMPLLFVSGIIQRVYVAGQDGGDENNTVDLLLNDGSVRMVGIYVNDKADILLFRIGCWVEIVYAQDELKKQPAQDGSINCTQTAL